MHEQIIVIKGAELIFIFHLLFPLMHPSHIFLEYLGILVVVLHNNLMLGSPCY